uniref:Uncharacterized protein n=1 Tax=Haptolina brevifila TaxID=156173 RepID=A0A7S2N8W1_9EUKA
MSRYYTSRRIMLTVVLTSLSLQASSLFRPTLLNRSPRLVCLSEEQGPVEALAAAMAAQQGASEALAEGATELVDYEAQVAEELGLTADELEVFMDGQEEEQASEAVIEPVEALANLMTVQEEVGNALQEAEKEIEEIESAIAAELGVTVQELELVEDGDEDGDEDN